MLKVFTDLKARGLLDILILCGDGLTGLPAAVASAYPHADLQLCVVHHVRNVSIQVASILTERDSSRRSADHPTSVNAVVCH